MRNVKLVVSYDGTDFFGWQIQPNRRTVQQELEQCLSQLTQVDRVKVNASGRTDTGVHAVGQVVNFYTASHLPAEVFVRALNAQLPEDIRIVQGEEVPTEFDANRDAVRKLYRYVMTDVRIPNLFMRRFCHHCRHSLDDRAMSRAASALCGRHDFRCFETDWPNRKTSVRTITHLSLNRIGEWIWLDVEADGFLYNMVRAIVGTLINVGRGYWPEERVAEIIEKGDRTLAGPNAPAQGLFLMRVTY